MPALVAARRMMVDVDIGSVELDVGKIFSVGFGKMVVTVEVVETKTISTDTKEVGGVVETNKSQLVSLNLWLLELLPKRKEFQFRCNDVAVVRGTRTIIISANRSAIGKIWQIRAGEYTSRILKG
ncbi:hypothetical protein HELRODRAFT_163540 [Helobdella robusta]|uniref:Uncharacterized protein n=1 Tax=Helobdella robusta TaxID=6412 RepID=T1EU63_HELRO|nr:hypothetical protein HELRODRAFT_163540 [Helobdella robusta]ESN96473.1 hypothetical protein HELRODRAFT_163540 [Helobdella robusta]